MKCRRPRCNNSASSGRHQGFCQKHYASCPTRGLVDATDAIERVALLRSRGYSWDNLSKLTGVDADTLSRLGLWSANGSMEKATHLKIMNAPVPEQIIDAGNSRIPNVGTKRRIEALLALGYSLEFLANELGVTQTCVCSWLRKKQVTSSTVVRIRDLYDRLSMTRGPSKRARMRAQKKGLAPPLAWDDESIDDPSAVPQLGDETRVTKMERYRELHWLGYSQSEISERLGVKNYVIKSWESQAGIKGAGV